MDEPQSRRETAPPTPVWVRLLVVGFVLAMVLVVVLMLLIGGEHGPSRHA